MSKDEVKGYIKFRFIKQLTKTKVYHVIAKRSDDYLGAIKWFSRWRQYSFHPVGDTIFNTQCLKDICEFTEKLNQEHKKVKYETKKGD